MFKMFRILCVIVAVAFIGSITAQIIVPGQCPKLKQQKSFDFQSFLGTWYDYLHYPYDPLQNWMCTSLNFNNLEDNSLNLLEKGISTQGGQNVNITGVGYILNPGQLNMVYTGTSREYRPNYAILGTDYTSWAIVVDCKNNNDNTYTVNLFVLTRARKPTAKSLTSALSTIQKNKYDLRGLVSVDQFNCKEEVAESDFELFDYGSYDPLPGDKSRAYD